LFDRDFQYFEVLPRHLPEEVTKICKDEEGNQTEIRTRDILNKSIGRYRYSIMVLRVLSHSTHICMQPSTLLLALQRHIYRTLRIVRVA
jgi:hypothetical protein